VIRFCSTTICLLTLLAVTLPLWAKGDMVLVEIMGGQLPSTIKITDSNIDEFNIWAGPGVNGVSLEQAEGFIINWKAGAAAAPGPALEHYQIAFYAGCRAIPDDPRCLAEKPHLAYVVLYDYDRKAKRGFVYLPRIKEPWGGLNGGSIYRGNTIEGHWFHSSDAWQSFVEPILGAAASGPRH
jgi:alkanesulfonate monooxygenase SsuD/methylene tetrahydromethanopterin reductase-like flavin-dependent oxidoreductase (luciferase family)